MVKKTITYLFTEFPVRNKSLGQLAGDVGHKGDALLARLATRKDSEKNRKVLNHIIGIERWSQSRLKVALGEPYIDEEYDGYRPNRGTSWDELKTQFAETRGVSAEIAQQLADNNISIDTKINHNQFGDVTVRGWLHYLMFHSNTESKRLR